ncbi:MAG: PQQ-binding-like beta-propeller repeat protein [Candidatus Coatesbacteria bacterium]|nr:PQQ-binding-like beta-propeller repeat protein [Candidatus Coatesbacteria bacterium]
MKMVFIITSTLFIVLLFFNCAEDSSNPDDTGTGTGTGTGTATGTGTGTATGTGTGTSTGTGTGDTDYIKVLNPPAEGADAGDYFDIRWEARYSGAKAWISLYYDNDTNEGGEIPIIKNMAAWNNSSYAWDCSSIPGGNYYIKAVLSNDTTTLGNHSIIVKVIKYAIREKGIKKTAIKKIKEEDTAFDYSDGPVRIKRSNNLSWKFKTDGEVYNPQLSNYKVYFESGDNYLYSLNAYNGSLLLKYKITEVSRMTVSNDLICIKQSGAINIIDSNNGSLKWTKGTWGPAIINNNLVYTSSIQEGTDSIYLLALSASDGSIVWKNYLGKNHNEYRKYETLPGSIDCSESYVITGITLKNTENPTRPVWYHWSLYGSAKNNGSRAFVLSDTEEYTNYWSLSCIDYCCCILSNKLKIYNLDSQDLILEGNWNEAIISNDYIYITDRRGYLYSLYRHSGDIQWKTYIGNISKEKPCIKDNSVYIGNLSVSFYSIDKNTGNNKWTYHVGSPVTTSPASDYGFVYFGSSDTYLYALNTAGLNKKYPVFDRKTTFRKKQRTGMFSRK